MIVHRFAAVPYGDGLGLQQAARTRVLAGGPDELLILEHPAVVTLGRRGGTLDEEALGAQETPIVTTDRGGFATWHGPGQLVAYPVCDLKRLGISVPAFVARLGEALARVCHRAGVKGTAYDAERPGVYVEGRKLGAIGLHIHRGVTTHGVALNVSCDLDGFHAIVPCGLEGLAVTTLAHETGRTWARDVVADWLVAELGAQEIRA